MDISVIVPIHNEGLYLRSFIEQFLEELPGWIAPSLREVLLIENGSSDGSEAVCRALAADHTGLIRSISLPAASYGAAIVRGIEEAAGALVVVLECDGLDTAFLCSAYQQHSSASAQLVVGSKRHPSSIDMRSPFRRACTVLLSILIRQILGYPGSDTRGLKSLHSDVAKRIVQQCQTSGELLQTELLLRAWRAGHSIIEVPVRIVERRPARLPAFGRICGMLGGILRLRTIFGKEVRVSSSAVSQQ